VKKPTVGWLVVSGRRGHYDFCDELCAFDLGTGSMYRVAASCSDLALTPGGRVNHGATDAARKLDRERGTVSLGEIREAAWMMLQFGELDERVLSDGFGQALPPGIPPESDGGKTMGELGSFSVSTSSGQTQLDWRVIAAGHDLGTGTITWPRDPDDDVEAYAAELLEVAEASFTPGCPPASPLHHLSLSLRICQPTASTLTLRASIRPPSPCAAPGATSSLTAATAIDLSAIVTSRAEAMGNRRRS
jgi:hypothetical protein